MPEYLYRCHNGHDFTRYNSVKLHKPVVMCEVCYGNATQIITAPLMVKVAQDVCYDSPIDGAPVTSWAQRTEDLKRNNCVPYDPGQKEDYARRQKDSEADLDRKIDAMAEETVSKMPTKERGKLYSELVDQGVNAEYGRSTITPE